MADPIDATIALLDDLETLVADALGVLCIDDHEAAADRVHTMLTDFRRKHLDGSMLQEQLRRIR
jgi:hypothetical protein